MQNNENRYEVWKFEFNAAENFANDNGCSEDSFYHLLEINAYCGVIEYGEKLGMYDNEDRAMEVSSDYFENNMNCDIYIWDNEERIWFN